MLSSANKEIEDLMFVPLSLENTNKSSGPSTDPEARHSLYVYDQNKNLVNTRIATYLIGRTAVG